MSKICPELSGVGPDGKFVAVKCKQHECAKWIQIQGVHPQTGDTISEWDCTHNWQTVLLIENSQQQRQTGAAIESFRNEVVLENERMLQLATTKVIKVLDSHD